MASFGPAFNNGKPASSVRVEAWHKHFWGERRALCKIKIYQTCFAHGEYWCADASQVIIGVVGLLMLGYRG